MHKSHSTMCTDWGSAICHADYIVSNSREDDLFI